MKTPSCLTKSALAMLKSIKGCVADDQLPLLISYCQCWSEYLQATEDIAKHGSYCTLPNGSMYLHPAVKRQQISQNMLAKLAKQFKLKQKEGNGKWDSFE